MKRDRNRSAVATARAMRTASPVAHRSPLVHRFMVSYFRRYFVRHMNALRVARWGMPGLPAGGPVVVYSNHPGWWDAAVYLIAADHFLPAHESYAPIDAAMLERYGIFARIGAYGIEPGTARGAAGFLKAGRDVLSSPRRALWVAAQGRFADVRERPLGLKPGLARLAEIAPDSTFLPLAVEYAFWLERGPEACIAFGSPLPGRALAALPRAQRLQCMESGLVAALDRLGADVQSRDPARFTSILEGRAGIGGVYDAWRRVGANLRGRRFDPSHGGRAP